MPKHNVVKWSGIMESSWYCEECHGDWENCRYGKNSLMVAKRHATAHGHTVHVSQVLGVTWTPPGSAYEQRQAARGK